MVIPHAIEALVDRLLRDADLVLVDGASPQAVVAELLGALQGQAAFAQLGPFVSGVLLRSELVEELFVDDHDIVVLLSDLEL